MEHGIVCLLLLAGIVCHFAARMWTERIFECDPYFAGVVFLAHLDAAQEK